MEVCPPGFFCFDKNTLMLIVMTLVVIVVFYISKNNDKFSEISRDINNNKNKLEAQINNLKSTNNNLENKLQVYNHIADEARFVANKDMNRIVNPLMGPERSHPYRLNRVGVPVNVPTRGYPTGYQQVGVLIEENSNGENKLLPLFGEQTYPGSRQWRYYTSSDGYQSVKLPILHKNRNCQDSNGCDEIYEGQNVTVTGYGSKSFKANIYKLDAPRYIPYII